MTAPPPPRHGWLDPIVEWIGMERELNTIATRLRDVVRSTRAPVIGAMHVTCSDEAQQETHVAFQRGFVDHVLPSLKFSAADSMAARATAG